jgi:transposase
MDAYLGLDVAKSSCAAHLLIGDTHHKLTFPNDPDGFSKLLRWLADARISSVSACLEPTSTYHLDLATRLYHEGHTVFVANPWSVKQFAKATFTRGKTDGVDACVLAEYACAKVCRHPWAPPAPELAELTALHRRRAELVDRTVALVNQRGTARYAALRESLSQEIAFVHDAILQIDAAIREHIAAYPELREQWKLLQSIPGIGPVTATALLAEMGDWRRFDNADQLAAYAGLTPRPYESGSSVRGATPLCPLGSHRLRRALYMSAVTVMRNEALFPAFIARLRRQGRKPKVILAALMRRMMRLVYGVLKSEAPYDPKHQPDRPQPAAESAAQLEVTPIQATMETRGETEAGSAGEQPAKGYPRGAHQPVIARGGLTLPHAPIPSPSPGGRLPMPPKTH